MPHTVSLAHCKKIQKYLDWNLVWIFLNHKNIWTEFWSKKISPKLVVIDCEIPKQEMLRLFQTEISIYIVRTGSGNWCWDSDYVCVCCFPAVVLDWWWKIWDSGYRWQVHWYVPVGHDWYIWDITRSISHHQDSLIIDLPLGFPINNIISLSLIIMTRSLTGLGYITHLRVPNSMSHHEPSRFNDMSQWDETSEANDFSESLAPNSLIN